MRISRSLVLLTTLSFLPIHAQEDPSARSFIAVPTAIPLGTLSSLEPLSRWLEQSGWAKLQRLSLVVLIFALIETIGAELRKAKPELVLEPTDVRGVEAFGKDGCTIRTLTKCAPGKQFDVARLLRKRVIECFREEGIASPIPQRIVHTKTFGEDQGGSID